MRRMHFVFAAALALLAGCASPNHSNPITSAPGDELAIQHRLRQIFEAAEKKELQRLDSYHAYGPRFTKFAVESVMRQDAATARLAEHGGLSAVSGMSMNAEDLKIDILGHVGIATFILNYGFDTQAGRVEKKARSTLVFVKSDGAWKIIHEHFSEY